MPNYTRREFIGAAAAGAAALMTPTLSTLAATHRTIPIGVQLYSVRGPFEKDIPGTLKGVKDLGFEGVEFAGYFSMSNDAKGLRKLLDDNGLKACGTHLQGGLNIVTGDALDATVEFNSIIGNSKLIVPSLQAKTADAWKQNADKFNAVVEKLKPHNMKLGFHNHWTEFTALPDGTLPEDIFFGEASPEVFIQLDIGHAAHGAGADAPANYLKKYSGRVLTVHAKDYKPDTRPTNDFIGEGIVKWPDVFAACDKGAVEWYIIEEESNILPNLEGIKKSMEGLKKLLAA